jgi:hypothetical protein
MIAATCVGVFLIPTLYVFWESLRERTSRMFQSKGDASKGAAGRVGS